MKIKVLELTKDCMPDVIEKGDWYDLKSAEKIVFRPPYKKPSDPNLTGEDKFEVYSGLIRLGVCIQVPKGYECILAPRSSTFKKYNIIQTNGIGVIDNSYCSDQDEWCMPVLSFGSTVIPKGVRIAQFRIQLSQKATLWQKIKWLLSPSIKIEKVESLDNPRRGGFGSSGN